MYKIACNIKETHKKSRSHIDRSARNHIVTVLHFPMTQNIYFLYKVIFTCGKLSWWSIFIIKLRWIFLSEENAACYIFWSHKRREEYIYIYIFMHVSLKERWNMEDNKRYLRRNMEKYINDIHVEKKFSDELSDITTYIFMPTTKQNMC